MFKPLLRFFLRILIRININTFHSGFMGGSVSLCMCLFIQHYPLQNFILISRIVVKSIAEFRL